MTHSTSSHVKESDVPTLLPATDLRCEYLENPLGIDRERPRLSWKLPSSPDNGQSAYRILVASHPRSLERDHGDLWDTGKKMSSETVFIEYAGAALSSRMDSYWKVQYWNTDEIPAPWSKPSHWSMGLLQPSDWGQARYIGLSRASGVPDGAPLPFPWLRHRFELSAVPRRAIATINPLGYYELYVNGRKVDDSVLAPSVTDYARRSVYVTHDLTRHLVPGPNCLALWLGRGWYVRGHPGVIHDGPLVRALVELEEGNGERRQLRTDASWKVHASSLSPLGSGLAFGNYGGEHHDARLDCPDWNQPEFDDSAWDAASVFDPPETAVTAQGVEPNRVLSVFPAIGIESEMPGEWTLDFGRNTVGWLELRLPESTPAGDTIRSDYADGPLRPGKRNTYNQWDTYITRDGAQTIRSRFNYHGFRHARLTGLRQAPSLQDARVHFIRTAYRPAAAFECSNGLLNRIHRAVNWTFENLSLGGYVVDCPTRERLGYGGDGGTSIETGLLNFDTGALYTNWASLWRDAQTPEGDLPYTAPAYPDQGGGGPMWCNFAVTLPWQVYLTYGDRRVLHDNYPMIQRWLGFVRTKTRDAMIEPFVNSIMTLPQWCFLGDWSTPRRPDDDKDGRPARDPVLAHFIINLHYLYTLRLASRIATILGQSGDAAAYTQDALALAESIQRRYWDDSRHAYLRSGQAYLALALLLRLPPEEDRPQVMRALEEDILDLHQGHLDVGMHGHYFLLKLLMEEDRHDLIFTMVNRTSFPSWGYMLEQDATTIWEHWGGGSHIHNCLLGIGSWFIQGIGGIRLDETSPGFRHTFISPGICGDLTYTRTRFQSPYGEIASDWRIENGFFHLEVAIPPGATATVCLPGENARILSPGSFDPRPVRHEGGRTYFEVEPGVHTFSSRLTPSSSPASR